MFISDTEAKHMLKTAIVYFCVSILCIVITNVYALFGHGVRSDSMDFMFLYPLLGGTLVFLITALVLPCLPKKLHGISRIGYNFYNSGIASLTSTGMLTGIMEIAGTSSKWIQYIETAGIVLLIIGIICQVAASLKQIFNNL